MRRLLLAGALSLTMAVGPIGCGPFDSSDEKSEPTTLSGKSTCADWLRVPVSERRRYARTQRRVYPGDEFDYLQAVCVSLRGPRDTLTLGETISRLSGVGALR